jgi:hypothetical protein
MDISPVLGLDRVKPVHKLLMTQDKRCKCSIQLNYIARDGRLKKVGGTEAYNGTALTNAVPWVHRSYHKRADSTFVKRTFLFSGGSVYYGNDLTGALTACLGGFNVTSIPMQATMQVSENSILYFFSGEDEVYKYDGNGSFTWEPTTLNADTGKTIVGAAPHLDRFWYWFKNSSSVIYSRTLAPEDLTVDSDEIIVGQETDSTIMALVVGAGETLYLFKNQSIYQLYGRTPSTFEFRKITDKYGLAAKRAIFPVGGGFVFLNELDKELYFFGGTESSITPLTEESIRLKEILDITHIKKVCMTVHKGLFRMAYTHLGDDGKQTRELVYPTSEPGPDGLPIWSMLRETRVYSYSIWNQQGDDNLLLTGRSDTGKIVYHDRTNQFDGENIFTQFRTREVVASEDKVVRFKGFWFRGHPTGMAGTVTFNYYVNGRTSSPGVGALELQGERRVLGSIKISTQELVNNRIIPLHNSSLGNSISFELLDESADSLLEIYSIAFKSQSRYKLRNALVG